MANNPVLLTDPDGGRASNELSSVAYFERNQPPPGSNPTSVDKWFDRYYDVLGGGSESEISAAIGFMNQSYNDLGVGADGMGVSFNDKIAEKINSGNPTGWTANHLLLNIPNSGQFLSAGELAEVTGVTFKNGMPIIERDPNKGFTPPGMAYNFPTVSIEDFRSSPQMLSEYAYGTFAVYSYLRDNASTSSWTNLQTGIGAFGVGWSIKGLMIKGAVADARGISMAQAGKSTISQVRALGTSGAGYMKWASRIGKGATVLGGLATIGDAAVNGGWQAHHAADLGIQVAIYSLSASVPVAGWLIGGAYFLGDVYFQSTHNGMSITQYYLDGKK